MPTPTAPHDGADLSPERALLLASCRALLGLAAPPAGGPDIRWDRVTDEARAQGVFAPVAHALAENRSHALPERIRDKWRDMLREQTLHAMGMLAVADTLLARWDGEGIPALLFKGPVFSMRGLGAPGLRISRDIDLLVRPEDLEAAIASAERAGFSCPLPWTGDLRELYVRDHFEWPLLHCDTGLHVDLHFRILPPWIPIPLTAGDILATRADLSITGKRFMVPCPFHDVLIALANGHKHGFSRLRNLADLLFALRQGPELPDRLARWLREAGLVRWAHVPLARLEYLGWMTEEAVRLRDGIGGVPLRRSTFWFADLRLFPSRSVWRERAYVFIRLRGCRERAGYAWRLLFALRPRDVAWADLPRPLRFLYWPIRFLRLAGEGIARCLRRGPPA